MSAFDEQPPRDQITGLIWVLGFISYALMRSYRAQIRFRIAFQRTALHELDWILEAQIVRTDPIVYRTLHRARECTLSIYSDARPRFALAAVDEVSRAIDLLRERMAEHAA